jgi:hypothetical protein
MSAETVTAIKLLLMISGALLWVFLLGVLVLTVYIFLIKPVIQEASLPPRSARFVPTRRGDPSGRTSPRDQSKIQPRPARPSCRFGNRAPARVGSKDFA